MGTNYFLSAFLFFEEIGFISYQTTQMSQTDNDNSEGMSLGRTMIAAVLFLLAAYMGYTTFFPNGISFPKSAQGFRKEPKTIDLTYRASDFKANINEEEALRILSNPQQNRTAFNALIKDFNTQLLQHVAVRMGLPVGQQKQVVAAYDKHEEYLSQLYYNDFIGLKDTTSSLYQSWYENESANAVDLLNEVASKYTCFFVSQILSSVLQTTNGRLEANGNKVETPCGVALTEALRPMINRLKDKAAIADFGRSKGMIREKVEKAIIELATMEVRDKKGLSKQLQTKVWGYAVSSTDFELTAISILKVGFKLDTYFELGLDGKSKTVTVYLPQPSILSHEVYPKVEKLDIGWLRELSSIDFNKNINILREDFRSEALNSDILTKSKQRAAEVMTMMLGPMVSQMPGYQLKVRFMKEGATAPDAKK